MEARRAAAGYSDGAIGRGMALRDILRRGLESLRPALGEADPTDERWRHYLIVTEQYLGGRRPDYVADWLSLARSTYDHEQAAALDRLAGILNEWSAHPPADLATRARGTSAPFMAPPRGRDGLIGREDLVAALRSRLTAGRGDLALHGLPGVGKTALAVELAHDPQVRAAFPDGVLWTGLGRQPDVVSQLALWAAALGQSLVEFHALSSPTDRARELHLLLAGRRALLVIDDVWEASQGLVFRLG
ncbi:MAG TPA: NB-ARC domain-containing protein, partial [Anaerolineales bacterium]|nr:NB-ARC domain-containing protein [Anaerolineales bacterium]